MRAEAGATKEKSLDAASGFGRAWFALTVAFALHVFDEATTGFLERLQPNRHGNTLSLGMVSRADVRVPGMAGGSHYRGRVVLGIDPAGGSRQARVAAAGMVLCHPHVLERRGTRAGYDFGANRRIGDIPAAGAGILLVTVPLYWIGVADGESVADKESLVATAA